MKAILVLEDTPAGLTLSGTFRHNGVTDHATDSVSTTVALWFTSQLLTQHRRGTLRVDLGNTNLVYDNSPDRR